MIRARSLAAVLTVASFAACKGAGDTHEVGATSFVSAAPNGAGRGGVNGGATAADGANGAPVPASASPTGDAGASSSTPRTIEEADIYKRDGSTLYVLNTYRGLQIVDLSDLRNPRLVGRVAITGNPVDLYLRGHTAVVAVNDAFAYYLTADGSIQPHRGSRVLAVDVTNPAAPAVVTDLPIEGAVEQTRLVGDVLYVASHRYSWYDWAPGVAGVATATAGVGVASSADPAGGDTFYVASFDLTDAAHPKQAARIDFPATGWDSHAHVTQDRITLSFAGYAMAANGAYLPTTRFQVIDISDPAGALVVGASFSTAGQVKDRWGMDYDETSRTFRAAVNVAWNAGAAVDIWSSPDANTATPLSHTAIDVPETLTAARFDGSRIYVVTARRTDPLWVIDASDPAHPRNAGNLHMPGQLDFVEPRGDRLVALGHTDEAGQPWQLQVSLVNVSDVANMTYARVLLGSGYGQVAAKPDDLRKAFLVFDAPADGSDVGLVLVPYWGWDRTTYRSSSGVQLIELGRDTLTLRGFIGHPGMVTRAFPVDAARRYLAALSDASLQTIDGTNRASPVEMGRIDLARSVSTLAVAHGKAIELAGDFWTGVTQLVVTDALDPDAPVPLARLDVGAPQGRLLQDGDLLWMLSTDWNAWPYRSWVQGVDVSDPVHPRMRGRIDLQSSDAFGFVRYWGYGNDALLVNHSLVVHHAGSPCFDACAASANGGTSYDPSVIRVYDLSDPDQPTLASTVSPSGAAWAYGLKAVGSFLWLTHFEWDGSRQRGRYYLDRIDLSDPGNPQLLPKINVPGVLFAATADGSRLFTLETDWTSSGHATVTLHRLVLEDASTARLEASIPLDGWPSGDAVSGRYAWLAVQPSSYPDPTHLVTVDLDQMRVTSDQQVKGSWAWLRTAAGGKLFLIAGWNEQGVILYDLHDPARPAFDEFVRTSSWVWEVVVADGRAYLPSGPYGVPIVELH